jgi:hypothetical protein
VAAIVMAVVAIGLVRRIQRRAPAPDARLAAPPPPSAGNPSEPAPGTTDTGGAPATPSAFPTSAAAALPEVDGCLCVFEHPSADPDGGPRCRTILCNEPLPARCVCSFVKFVDDVYCKVPPVRGKCPPGKIWTGREVVAKDESCFAYLPVASGTKTESISPQCSVCYAPKPRRAPPNELCYAYDPLGKIQNGRWMCGPNAAASKPPIPECLMLGTRDPGSGF